MENLVLLERRVLEHGAFTEHAVYCEDQNMVILVTTEMELMGVSLDQNVCRVDFADFRKCYFALI